MKLILIYCSELAIYIHTEDVYRFSAISELYPVKNRLKWTTSTKQCIIEQSFLLVLKALGNKSLAAFANEFPWKQTSPRLNFICPEMLYEV